MKASLFAPKELSLMAGSLFWRVASLCVLIASIIGIGSGWWLFYGYPKDQTMNLWLNRLIIADQILISLLLLLIARLLLRLWRRWRADQAGAHLHGRLVILFAVLAGLPALLVATSYYLFFEFGLNAWFADRTRTAILESQTVAHAYLVEHQRSIAADALRIAQDLGSDLSILRGNLVSLSNALNRQVGIRNISEAIIIDGASRQIIARAGFSVLLELEPISDELIAKANAGDVSIIDDDFDDRVRALVRLANLGDLYLLVGRLVDPQVLARVAQSEGAVQDYQAMLRLLPEISLSFALGFGLAVLTLLYLAIWVAMLLADRISRPLAQLIGATEEIAADNLEVQLIDIDNSGIEEIKNLSLAFTRMTGELHSRRQELMATNRVLEERRAFQAAVLAGVSSGVIGLDRFGRIELANQAAERLLSLELIKQYGAKLTDIVPDFAPLVNAVIPHEPAESTNMMTKPLSEAVEQEILYHPPRHVVKTKATPSSLHFLARLTVEASLDAETPKLGGFVLTFDNIGPLMEAQRRAAWSDVARRIAHEIRNPLTPILLATERLEKRFLSHLEGEDRRTSDHLLQTISRKVSEIGRMVEEFSSFARMPAPQFQLANLQETCREAMFLHSTSLAHIQFVSDFPTHPLDYYFDPLQLGQVLTNLLKNAGESVEARLANQPQNPMPGLIVMRITQDENQITIAVIDNGLGLPLGETRDRLSEPYVTTRSKGTGLGLAIVRKIMQDHGGTLRLQDGTEWIHDNLSGLNLGESSPLPPEVKTLFEAWKTGFIKDDNHFSGAVVSVTLSRHLQVS